MSRYPCAVLVLVGTSTGMTRKISEHLDLPHPQKIIRIEEIATQAEIETAKRSRDHEGKHIIPVPALEIKRNYPQIFFDSIRIFLKRSLPVKERGNGFEKSVVRPEFGRKGKIAISETALSQMVLHCVSEFDTNLKVAKIKVKKESQNYKLEIILDVPYGATISSSIHELQQYIRENIEKFTGLVLDELDITIGKISIFKKDR